MKKYRINICETVPFNHTVIFESDAPNIEKVLDKAEKENCLDDVVYALKSQGCKVSNIDRDEGDYGEIEIDDLEEIKEDKKWKN